MRFKIKKKRKEFWNTQRKRKKSGTQNENVKSLENTKKKTERILRTHKEKNERILRPHKEKAVPSFFAKQPFNETVFYDFCVVSTLWYANIIICKISQSSLQFVFFVSVFVNALFFKNDHISLYQFRWPPAPPPSRWPPPFFKFCSFVRKASSFFFPQILPGKNLSQNAVKPN